MLRSLVGSEMCIRDSSSTRRWATWKRFSEAVQRFFISASKIVALIDANACLLYTSDAADDLLCVDLGGRRIIKKKKTI